MIGFTYKAVYTKPVMAYNITITTDENIVVSCLSKLLCNE